jgi:hypothetical protein
MLAKQIVDGKQVEPALKEPEIDKGYKARTNDRESARE